MGITRGGQECNGGIRVIMQEREPSELEVTTAILAISLPNNTRII